MKNHKKLQKKKRLLPQPPKKGVFEMKNYTVPL